MTKRYADANCSNGLVETMYFAYFDETGDTGMDQSPTGTFALSCILLHDANWLSALDQTIAFRRYLKNNFHISTRSELKANWLIHNKGDVKAARLTDLPPLSRTKRS